MESRRSIMVLLGLFSLLGYVLRMNISIASQFMMPELGLDKIQMGEVFSAFMLGYALFQIPWGVLGDRLGPRRVLTIAALIWGITTLLTGLVPGRWTSAGIAALASLLILRFLLGVGEAAAFPVAARAVATWMPSTKRAFSYSIVIVGSCIGSAFTGPLISWLMVHIGWRGSFYISSVLAFTLAIAWSHISKVRSGGKDAFKNGEPGDGATARPDAPRETRGSGSWWELLKDRNISLISLSYFLDSYILFIFVFWFYLYLVEQRGFSVLGGGLFTSLPFVAAIVFVPIAGHLCDLMAIRIGPRLGRRIVAMTGLTFSAIFLLIGVRVNNPYLAIGGLSLSAGFLFSTEGAFWSSSIDTAGENVGAAGGIMNTAGNLGGVVSTALVPVLVKKFGWDFAFGSAAALAIIGASLWLFIRVDQSMDVGARKTALHEVVQ